MTADTALYHKLQGSGPLLLLLPGGDGDADASDQLAGHLTDHYTVLTYDRRGLKRSPLAAPTTARDLAGHGRDAAQLLAAVTDEPALVFGSSIGALIGLDLVTRHPDQVRLLVAHEPPAPELLPEPERRRAVAEQEEIETLYRQRGLPEAMMRFLSVAGIRFDDREEDVALPRPSADRIVNLEFFLAHDVPAVRRHRLDVPGLRAVAQKIVPAAGTAADGQSFASRCAHELGAVLERTTALFPGGHTGPLLRPRAFAAQLREVLAGG